MWSTPTACPVCGAPSVAGSPYCAAHPRARERQFDKEKREPYHKWYGWSVWKRLRMLKLHRAPLCEWPGCTKFATDVHHVVDHKGDWQKFLTLENLQSLCAHHHSAATARRTAASRA